MIEKQCGACKAVKSIDQFSNNSSSKDGLQYRCKECACKATKEYSRRNKAREIAPSDSPKICRVCKVVKQSREFSRNAGNKDGLRTECKTCMRDYLAGYDASNKDRAKARKAEYYVRNKEVCRALNKKWHDANKARIAEKKRVYYQKNKVRLQERNNQRYQEKGEEIRARLTAYRAANPERRRAIDGRMRAKRLSASGSHTSADIANLMKLQRGKCVVCRCDIRNSYHVDHIEPLARGGSNDRDNLQLLCPPCNKRKHARDPIDFMNKQGYLL